MNNPCGFRGVRVSKFRHVYGQCSRRESCYEGMRITTSAHDSQFCAVNPKFVAVAIDVAGGGAFQVLPLRMTGKVGYEMGRVCGHKGPVTDLQWNPFNDNIIASCSDDATIKLWHIPDEGIRGERWEWLCELTGHSRRVTYIQWHPTADGLLASISTDCRLLLWNITSAECIVAIDCHPDTIYSMSFNKCGSLIATTCKDRMLRVIDIRTASVIQESQCHEGGKSSKVAFLGDRQKLVTTGFSRTSRRQFALWNQNDLSRPLLMQEVDSSSGVLFPFYDADLNILYIAGKGDGNIRYYEIMDAQPYMHYLSEFQSRFPHRGLGAVPKRALNVSINEIFRFYKVHSTQPLIEPISFIVPRKSETFQSDLYPATAGFTPAMSADEFLCGMDRDPVLVSLNTGFVATTSKPVQVKMSGGDKQPVLIACDRNNERKFRFLSEITKPDYREVNQREDFEQIIKDQQLKDKLKEQKLKQEQQSTDSSPALTPRGGIRSEDEMFVTCLSPPPPRSPGAQSAPTGSLSRIRPQFPAHSPNKVRRISHSPKVGHAIYEDHGKDTNGHCSPPPAPLVPKAVMESFELLSSPSPPHTNGSLDTTESGSRDLSSPPPLGSSVDQSRLPTLSRPQAIKSTVATTSSTTSFRPPTQPPKSTRPGCIGPAPIVHKEQPQAHIRPFRISSSQPPPVKKSSSLSANEQEGTAAIKDKDNSDIRKLYASQCQRVREVMETNEQNERRVSQLEQDVTSLTARLEGALTDGQRHKDDVKSLRYEIKWKNERIEYLEHLLKEQSNTPTERRPIEPVSSPEPDF